MALVPLTSTNKHTALYFKTLCVQPNRSNTPMGTIVKHAHLSYGKKYVVHWSCHLLPSLFYSICSRNVSFVLLNVCTKLSISLSNNTNNSLKPQHLLSSIVLFSKQYDAGLLLIFLQLPFWPGIFVHYVCSGSADTK